MPFFDDFKTLRNKAGLRISEIALKANLDRGTIKRIETHKNASEATLARVVNAMNELYFNNSSATRASVIYEKVITAKSKYGEGKDASNKKDTVDVARAAAE